MSRATDLILVAELIKLAAKTAAALVGDKAINGSSPAVIDAIKRIDAAADLLAKAGQKLEERNPQKPPH